MSRNLAQRGFRGMARPALQYVRDLPQKIDFLIEFARSRGATDLGTLTALARVMEIDNTVLAKIRNDKTDYFSRLTVPAQERLAARFGFELSWPEWRDATSELSKSTSRSDSASDFRQRYLVDARWGSVEMASVSAEDFLRHAFAAEIEFAHREKRSSSTTVFCVSSVMSFGSQPVDVGEIAVRKGTLSLTFENFSVQTLSRFARTESVNLQPSDVRVRSFGRSDFASWEFASSGHRPLLCNVAIENPPLCLVESTATNGSAEVRFTTFPRDLVLVGIDEGELEVGNDNRAGEPLAPAASAEANKNTKIKRALAAVIAKKLERVGDEVILSRYRFVLRRGSADSVARLTNDPS